MLASLWRICLISVAVALRESGLHNESIASTGRLRIKAYWIRHGQSCANVLNDQFNNPSNPLHVRAEGISFSRYQDPPLTDCAVSRAQKLGEPILKQILEENPKWKDRQLPLFSSVMVRAMETALYNFPSWNLFPMTNIAEQGRSLDNIPRAWEDQLEHFLEHFHDTSLERIKFWVSVNPSETDEDRSAIKHKSNYEIFLKRFAQTLMGLLPIYFPELGQKLINEQIEDDDVLPVIIVSHSKFMKESLSCNAQRKPENNEVWVQDYYLSYSSDVEKLHLEPGSCTMEFPVEVPSAKETILCPSMVERCTFPWKPPRFSDQCGGRDVSSC